MDNEINRRDERGQKKERVGVVVKAKMAKTIVVEVERLTQHPQYHKVIKRRKRYVAHDEQGTAKVGDKVRLIETRPMSKTKYWHLIEVVKV